jgi:ribosome biogenesis GTPase
MEAGEGVVVRAHGGHYYVQTKRRVIDCSLRGRLKKERARSDLVAVGDRVRWSTSEEGQGLIEEVLPRHSVLSRTPPPPRAQIEQVIVANPDQVLIVFSPYNPPLNPLMLDRYLVACEAVQLPFIIVLNKADLLEEGEEDPLGVYRRIGYDVCYTSTVTGQGLDELKQLLRSRISVLTGPSGVGKSSLLNALWPALELSVGEISMAHDRGRHTTVVPYLLNPEDDTYVADTPGLRQFRFWDIDPEQLDAFFPEMRSYLGHCRFSPCTHTHEPDCAVREAMERGKIDPLRFESYLRMFEHGF